LITAQPINSQGKLDEIMARRFVCSDKTVPCGSIGRDVVLTALDTLRQQCQFIFLSVLVQNVLRIIYAICKIQKTQYTSKAGLKVDMSILEGSCLAKEDKLSFF